MLCVSGVGGRRRRTRLRALKNVLLSCLGLGAHSTAQLDDSDVYELDTDFDFGENVLGCFLSYCQIFLGHPYTSNGRPFVFASCLFPYLKKCLFFSPFFETGQQTKIRIGGKDNRVFFSSRAMPKLMFILQLDSVLWPETTVL